MSSITEIQQAILSLPKADYLQLRHWFNELDWNRQIEVDSEDGKLDFLIIDSSRSLIERRAFLELPTDLRRSLLREQAKQMADYYQNDPEWRELEGGDLVEYKST